MYQDEIAYKSHIPERRFFCKCAKVMGFSMALSASKGQGKKKEGKNQGRKLTFIKQVVGTKHKTECFLICHLI